MAAGSDPKQPATSLLERWRAQGARPDSPRAPSSRPPPAGEPARPSAPPPSAPAPRADPAVLLAEIEEALAAALPPDAARTALLLLDPLRAAVRAPEGDRDPAALTLAFEQAEDVLEALLLVSPPRALGEG